MSGPRMATRVADDKHGRRARFEDIEVGKDLGTLTWEVTAEDIEAQCGLDDDHHPWFAAASPWGGPVAPPQIHYRPPRWLLSRNYNIRGVFYKWEFENIRPIQDGDKIAVSGRILDKWIKGEREFVSFEATGRNASGEDVFRTVRVHALDVTPRTMPRRGTGFDSGIKAERI